MVSFLISYCHKSKQKLGGPKGDENYSNNCKLKNGTFCMYDNITHASEKMDHTKNI